MVSGLVTSPCDQLRIFSGDAREMRIESKSAIKFARSYGEDLKISLQFLKSQWWGRPGPSPPRRLKPAPHLQLIRRQRRIRHFARLLHQLHIQAQRLQLADQHVERFWNARLYRGLAFHN